MLTKACIRLHLGERKQNNIEWDERNYFSNIQASFILVLHIHRYLHGFNLSECEFVSARDSQISILDVFYAQQKLTSWIKIEPLILHKTPFIPLKFAAPKWNTFRRPWLLFHLRKLMFYYMIAMIFFILCT